MAVTHQVDDLVLDLTFRSRADARRLGDDIQHWLEHELLPELDAVLTRYSPGRETLRIDTLQIDCGVMTARNYKQVIQKQLFDELERVVPPQLLALGPQISFVLNSGAAPEDTALQQLMGFLQSGQLPWHRLHSNDELHGQLFDQIAAHPQMVNLLQRAVRNEPVLRRLVRQFSETQLNQVLARIAPSLLPLAIAMQDLFDLGELTRKIGRAAHGVIHESQWIALLGMGFARQRTAPDAATLAGLLQTWFAAANASDLLATGLVAPVTSTGWIAAGPAHGVLAEAVLRIAGDVHGSSDVALHGIALRDEASHGLVLHDVAPRDAARGPNAARDDSRATLADGASEPGQAPAITTRGAVAASSEQRMNTASSASEQPLPRSDAQQPADAAAAGNAPTRAQSTTDPSTPQARDVDLDAGRWLRDAFANHDVRFLVLHWDTLRQALPRNTLATEIARGMSDADFRARFISGAPDFLLLDMLTPLQPAAAAALRSLPGSAAPILWRFIHRLSEQQAASRPVPRRGEKRRRAGTNAVQHEGEALAAAQAQRGAVPPVPAQFRQQFWSALFTTQVARRDERWQLDAFIAQLLGSVAPHQLAQATKLQLHWLATLAADTGDGEDGNRQQRNDVVGVNHGERNDVVGGYRGQRNDREENASSAPPREAAPAASHVRNEGAAMPGEHAQRDDSPEEETRAARNDIAALLPAGAQGRSRRAQADALRNARRARSEILQALLARHPDDTTRAFTNAELAALVAELFEQDGIGTPAAQPPGLATAVLEQAARMRSPRRYLQQLLQMLANGDARAAAELVATPSATETAPPKHAARVVEQASAAGTTGNEERVRNEGSSRIEEGLGNESERNRNSPIGARTTGDAATSDNTTQLPAIPDAAAQAKAATNTAAPTAQPDTHAVLRSPIDATTQPDALASIAAHLRAHPSALAFVQASGGGWRRLLQAYLRTETGIDAGVAEAIDATAMARANAAPSPGQQYRAVLGNLLRGHRPFAGLAPAAPQAATPALAPAPAEGIEPLPRDSSRTESSTTRATPTDVPAVAHSQTQAQAQAQRETTAQARTPTDADHAVNARPRAPALAREAADARRETEYAQRAASDPESARDTQHAVSKRNPSQDTHDEASASQSAKDAYDALNPPKPANDTDDALIAAKPVKDTQPAASEQEYTNTGMSRALVDGATAPDAQHADGEHEPRHHTRQGLAENTAPVLRNDADAAARTAEPPAANALGTTIQLDALPTGALPELCIALATGSTSPFRLAGTEAVWLALLQVYTGEVLGQDMALQGELLAAIRQHAARAGSQQSYYQNVLACLIAQVPLDLEELESAAAPLPLPQEREYPAPGVTAAAPAERLPESTQAMQLATAGTVAATTTTTLNTTGTAVTAGSANKADTGSLPEASATTSSDARQAPTAPRAAIPSAASDHAIEAAPPRARNAAVSASRPGADDPAVVPSQLRTSDAVVGPSRRRATEGAAEPQSAENDRAAAPRQKLHEQLAAPLDADAKSATSPPSTSEAGAHASNPPPDVDEQALRPRSAADERRSSPASDAHKRAQVPLSSLGEPPQQASPTERERNPWLVAATLLARDTLYADEQRELAQVLDTIPAETQALRLRGWLKLLADTRLHRGWMAQVPRATLDRLIRHAAAALPDAPLQRLESLAAHEAPLRVATELYAAFSAARREVETQLRASAQAATRQAPETGRTREAGHAHESNAGRESSAPHESSAARESSTAHESGGAHEAHREHDTGAPRASAQAGVDIVAIEALHAAALGFAQLLAQAALSADMQMQLKRITDEILQQRDATLLREWRKIFTSTRLQQGLTRHVPGHVIQRLLQHLAPDAWTSLDAATRVVVQALGLLVPDARSHAIEQARWQFLLERAFATGAARADADLLVELAQVLAAAAGLADSTRLLQLVERRKLALSAQEKRAQANVAERDDALSFPGQTPGDTAPDVDITGAVHLDNVGLVLAAPYIPRLFSMLKVTAGGNFPDHAAAERGMHLLQFLVTGQGFTPEYKLLLNKVLCGIVPGFPVCAGIDVAPQEKEVIEQLLHSMIQHWKILGTTSVAGLRQTFLQRQGWLRQDENGWHLEVKPGSFDMLLDQIPWNFSLIKFTWMDKPMHVTWRNKP